MTSSRARRLAGALAFAAVLPFVPQATWADIALPAPQNGSAGDPVLFALSSRASATSFNSAELTPQALSELLWAGFGVNRPAEQERRTAPSAHNYQDVDIYLATSNGLFLYSAPEHSLDLISASDVRTSVWGSGSYPAIAPVTLVYVSDTSTGVTLRQRYMHTGLIAMNVALYAAAENLQVRIQASAPASLRSALGLTANQTITLVHSIGHPTSANPAGQKPQAGPLVLPRIDDQAILRALKRRRSHSAYSSTALDSQTLANILWAGYGINRPGGKRTPPASWFTYNVALYALTSDGISRYAATSETEHQLVSVYSGTDARSHVQYPQAPVTFVLVSTPSELRSSQIEFSAVHVGLVASNINAYCSSAGLASKVYESITDAAALRAKMGLDATQVIELALSVGAMANPSPSYSVSFSAGAGGSLTGTTSQSVTLGADATAVTAVPAAGHRFVRWNGTVAGPRTENPLAVRNVVGNMSISAAFEAYDPRLSIGDVSVTETDGGTTSVEFTVTVDP